VEEYYEDFEEEPVKEITNKKDEEVVRISTSPSKKA
jgi:hypothetical protein